VGYGLRWPFGPGNRFSSITTVRSPYWHTGSVVVHRLLQPPNTITYWAPTPYCVRVFGLPTKPTSVYVGPLDSVVIHLISIYSIYCFDRDTRQRCRGERCPGYLETPTVRVYFKVTVTRISNNFDADLA
jgi:hypothetical protein